MPGGEAVVSWSGGKDGWLALLKARAAGLIVRRALTVYDEDGTRSRSHALPPSVIAAQLEALGLEPVAMRASWADYEARMVATLRELAAEGVGTFVTGDIATDGHRAYVERVAGAAGMAASLPLWGRDTGLLAREIVARRAEILVVLADAHRLDASFVGCRYDERFLARLPPGIDPCGENGEFHTFVAGGEGFAANVPLTIGEIYRHAFRIGDAEGAVFAAPLALAPAPAA